MDFLTCKETIENTDSPDPVNELVGDTNLDAKVPEPLCVVKPEAPDNNHVAPECSSRSSALHGTSTGVFPGTGMPLPSSVKSFTIPHLDRVDTNSPTSTFDRMLAAFKNPRKLWLPCKGIVISLPI